jgi:mannose-6-phosphate isomerase-like protein (cupin superfamily)
VDFETKRLPVARDVVAPDKSDVRVLLGLDHGGLAHFELGPDRTSHAVTHRTVEEIWFVLRGRGEMWRKQGEREEVVPLEQGVCVSIPSGTLCRSKIGFCVVSCVLLEFRRLGRTR